MAYIYVETGTVNKIDDVIININYTQFNSTNETKFLTDNINFLKLEVDSIYSNGFIDVDTYTYIHPSMFSYDGSTLTLQSTLADYYTDEIVASITDDNAVCEITKLITKDTLGIITETESAELSSLVSSLNGSYTIQTQF